MSSVQFVLRRIMLRICPYNNRLSITQAYQTMKVLGLRFCSVGKDADSLAGFLDSSLHLLVRK